ncbi:glycosyltransferase [Salinisphaera aquimarina]|uniref:Glycosyltransferase n=1 Tax=Salinisphaera aquimarina TaxID=2094031 RepID=A0ABV7ETH5_9GAMM
MSKVHSISVLISTFNRCTYLQECLDSLLAQSRPADQIIVIDDGSEDDTEAVVGRYESVLYVRQVNSGKSVALNHGMDHVTSSHVCFFDDDDFMLPDALAMHIEVLSDGPNNAYSYSPHLVFAEKAGQRIDDPAKWQPVTRPQSASDGEIFIRTLEWGDQFLTYLQGMLIRADVVRTLGGFDKELLRGQDYDMMLRLAYCVPALDVGSPTFVMRNHAGARGPARDRHSVERRFEVWHRYDQRIIRGYRNELTLSEYLPSAECLNKSDLSAEERCKALVTRFRIMFAHGLFTEGLEDLQRICKEPQLQSDQQARILASLVSATNFQHQYLVKKARPIARGLRQIERNSGTAMPLCKHASKGMYWSLVRSIKRQDISSSIRLSASLLMLLR